MKDESINPNPTASYGEVKEEFKIPVKVTINSNDYEWNNIRILLNGMPVSGSYMIFDDKD
jgi:hypothetical protein